VLSLTFLARLDSLLLAGVISLWLAWGEARRGLSQAGFTRLLALNTPPVLVCAAYISLNLYLFGHPWPVSSALKQAWSAYLLAHDPLTLAYGWVVAKAYHLLWPMPNFRTIWFGVFGVSSLWLLNYRWGTYHPWFERVIQPWGPLVVYSLASYLIFTGLYHGELSFTVWYFVIQRWLVAMVGAVLVEKMTGIGAGQPVPIGLVLALAIGGSVILLTMLGLANWRARTDLDRQPFYRGAQWVRQNLPDQAIIGAWNAGLLGYLSERRVVNLDGLVNSWAYYEGGRHDLCPYWDEMGITYLVDVFREDHQVVSIVPMAPAYAPCIDRLQLLWQNDDYERPWRLRVYRIQRNE
jgi:hypothetical protein